MKKPRIALLFAGGTIGMIPDAKTGVLTPATDALALFQMIPGLQEKVDIEIFHLYNVDSSNCTPTHWSTIAAKVHELYHEYDGFVVAQGTDTMAYSATATSFVLQNIGKPVVFTGSLVPMAELGADAHHNVIYAALVATMDIAEVCIVFGNKIIRGNRAKKNHESFVDVFRSPNFPLLGEIERPIRLHEWRMKRHEQEMQYLPGFREEIALITVFPGMNPEVLQQHMEMGASGIVLQGFGPGNIPFLENSLIPMIQKAVSQKIPVCITSQMEKSITNLDVYESGYRAREAGALSAVDMTMEAAVTKMMWVLAQEEEYDKRVALLQKPIAGEMTVE